LISSLSSESRIEVLTSNLADIDVESEFLVLQVEELVVLVLVVHEVDSGSNIAASLELKAQGVARCLDAVGTSVVSAVECAVCGASYAIRAKSLVKSVACVAVGGAGGGVEPTPVTVEHNALGLGRATGGGASRDGKGRVFFSSKSSSLLGADNRAEGKSAEGEGEGRHACRLFRRLELLAFVG
jgi:hypothetical protein